MGDALGYPVEFPHWSSMQKKYEARGITRYETTQGQPENSPDNDVAVVPDDTQMTLYTACGILNARKSGTAIIPAIREACVEWLLTQIGKRRDDFRLCWIQELPQLNVLKAPGNTRISSLMDIVNGHEPCKDDCGCGGVRRIAPFPFMGRSRTDGQPAPLPGIHAHKEAGVFNVKGLWKTIT